MRVKGRIWIAFWLVFVLVVLAWVTARDASGYVTAARLEEVRNRRMELQSRKSELVSRIRRSMSRSMLVPRAESLGLRLPPDSEIVIVQPPPAERR
jgi:hypothetical protein